MKQRGKYFTNSLFIGNYNVRNADEFLMALCMITGIRLKLIVGLENRMTVFPQISKQNQSERFLVYFSEERRTNVHRRFEVSP